ncbi:MAG: acyl-CoA dehydrogenase [Pseudomonadota bacterium]|nr:acyl-CoA dehydrogenase [Pseudomonadota bacterium]
MNFDRTEEQELIAASIARFVERDYTFEIRQRIVASESGCSDEVWRKMAELGLLGIGIPEAYGGLGGGTLNAMSLMEAIGDALVVEPWLATVGLGAQLLARGGNDEQRERYLPAVVDGSLRLAFAHDQPGARQATSDESVVGRPAPDGYVISGRRSMVAHAQSAHLLIVPVRSEDAFSAPAATLVIVARDAPGVTLQALRMLDGTRSAHVTFDRVRVGADGVIGAPGGASPLIAQVMDLGTALICAEAVGAIQSANTATLEYLRSRRQFGVPIGSFQALQHRMVDMVIEAEQAKSMASLACSSVDTEHDATARSRTVSAAKVRIGEACRQVSQESIQLHGGMGMSDELKVSHTFRRLTAIAQQFGDVDHHLNRFAALSSAAAGVN